ncbi:MAG: T9SS type A sorting domain-containing protein [Flavobacteriales bacterium]|nr:T9SS type A sorting domain-containing protein [Flavobacteriales bacterium]
MKKFLSILSLALFSSVLAFSQGTLVEDTVILQLSFDDINDLYAQNGIPTGIIPVDYEVDVHRVIYTTPDVDGITPTTASGLVFIPKDDTCRMPLMAYLHGTKVLRTEAFYDLQGEWFLGVLTASSGYVMCLPDYLGLGAGPGIHPYQHARSEATASVDILRSARIICGELDLELNDQLFLVGYSQGGHSVLATHRMIQEELSNEFTVTASAPGSGPYDMSGSQLDMVASFEPYSQPGYLPYLIQSYQHVYGNLYTTLQEIYVPPYDVTLPPLLDGSATMGQLNAAMPAVPREIFQQAYQDAFFSNPQHPAQVALRDNDVFQWIPESPVMFNYCRSDEEVTYLNTITASDYMIANGATDIQVIERDTTIGHFECAQPSIIFSKFWFDTMANFCEADNVGIADVKSINTITMFPNPVTDGWIQFSNDEKISVRLMDVLGHELVPATRIPVHGKMNITGIQRGVVLVEITQSENLSTQRLVIQ